MPTSVGMTGVGVGLRRLLVGTARTQSACGVADDEQAWMPTFVGMTGLLVGMTGVHVVAGGQDDHGCFYDTDRGCGADADAEY